MHTCMQPDIHTLHCISSHRIASHRIALRTYISTPHKTNTNSFNRDVRSSARQERGKLQETEVELYRARESLSSVRALILAVGAGN